MRRFWLAVIALLLLYCGVALGNYAATVGAGTNFGSVVIAGVHFASQLICDFTTANQCASVTASNALKVDPSAVTQPVSNAGTFAAQLTGATNNINNIAGTVSLPTGAATAANQTSPLFASSQNVASPTNAMLSGCQFNTTPTTITTTNSSPVQCSNKGSVNTFIDPASVNANGQATMANSAPVVIASNQSTLPANTAQVNGVTVLTGTGATGTGAQRVTVSTDQATNAGAALVKGGVGVVNGGSTYQAVAASQTATVLQTSTGAAGDYLSHCVIFPTSTSPGVVTVFDNTNTAATSAILFAGGGTSLSNLAPVAVPVGAVSTAGAWKVTTGASVSVVCYGKFS